jgi:hypothetical protein
MIQQPVSLSGITADKPQMLADALQVLEAGLFVLRIAINRERQHACLRRDHFDDRRREVPGIR